MVLVRLAFNLLIVLFLSSLSACEIPSKQKVDLATQAYLSQFQKRVLEVEFVVAKNTATQSEIVLIFNQPMVAFEQINQKLKNVDGISISPNGVVGEYEWIEPQMLVFRPLNAAPESQLQINVSAGISSLLGTALLRPVNFELIISGLPDVAKPVNWASNPNVFVFENVLQWPRLAAPVDAPEIANELKVQWRMPAFLNVGDRLQVEIEIQNLNSEKFTGQIQIESDGLMETKSQSLILEPQAKQLLVLSCFADQKLQEEIIKNFLVSNSVSIDKPITVALQNEQGTQNAQQVLKIFTPLDFEVQDDLGVLANVKKQKILSESFLRLQTGQLSLDFSLDAREMLQALVLGVEEAPTEDLIAKSLSLSPYVLFPKSTLAFGEEESVWQNHLDDVQQFLEELRSSMRFQVGRAFSANQLIHFAEFVSLAAQIGFSADDLKDQLGQLLLEELDLALNPKEQIAILWSLSQLDQDQTLRYNEYYLAWDKLDDVSQMQLASMILKMNPLHPVAKLSKRVVDKALFDQTSKPIEFWARAFRTLLTINPNDSLSFEVFAQIFINLKNNRSLQNDYFALSAFQLYQAKMTKIDQPVDLVVSLNNHEIMQSHLSWKNRSDGLILPVEKMPHQVVIDAQKNSGPFAFYRLHLKGLRQVSVVPIQDQGIRVNQSCYDEKGQAQSVFTINQKYICRVRWQSAEIHNNVMFEIPRLTGSEVWVDIPNAITSTQTAKLKVYLQQIQAGYGEFSYVLLPKFQGDFVATTLRVKSTMGGFFGGGFVVKPSKVLTP